MPIYDFACINCEKIFEHVCKISELDDRKICPNCGSIRVEQKILTAPARATAHRLGKNMRQREFKEVLGNIHRRTGGSVLDRTADIK
jgi:putative FmdB family regulatory protein